VAPKPLVTRNRLAAGQLDADEARKNRLSRFSLGLLQRHLQRGSRSRDLLKQKLLMRWQSLSSIASSNQFVDDGSCHTNPKCS